ncbi:MAG: SUMF1/EgtB/PvdO family nonheme iron enzyme, partial [Anaerolineae bacterium]|nr:SUMF1/EgtB/PvdO family nonheme iron enzyme [Anaerolineae bacterium]
MRKLYQALSKETWISPWLDEEELLPGMDWDYEIYKAFRDADVIIACLSQESVAKEGYVQREFKRALSYAEEKPEGTIYVIPLRLDDCTPPRKLNKYQWVDYFESNAQEKLLKSLRIRAENLKILEKTVSKKSEKIAPAVVTQKSVSNREKVGKHSIYTFAGMEFLLVPAGDFFMGADDIRHAKPEHLIYQLDYDFYVAHFPLTSRAYSRVARDIGKPIIMSRGKMEHPVVNVSWYDVQEYIKLLNEKYRNELPKNFRFCLPSEAEWEKAARGPEGNEYPWGNTFDKEKCNTRESGIGGTSPVGQFSPQGDSFYGATDMVGNVWEWTRSLWGFKYPYRFNDGRDDKKVKERGRVLRGGSFSYFQSLARCA